MKRHSATAVCGEGHVSGVVGVVDLEGVVGLVGVVDLVGVVRHVGVVWTWLGVAQPHPEQSQSQSPALWDHTMATVWDWHASSTLFQPGTFTGPRYLVATTAKTTQSMELK